MATYGYNWAQGQGGTTMSFDQTMATALNAGAKVNFNDDTYNLNFSYQDEDDGTLHQVFFPDAVTTFNIMRFGATYHLAGFGLWRLGTEDRRIWKYYGKDLSWESAARMPIAKIMQLSGTDDVNFVGSGEVLNVTSEPTQDALVSCWTRTISSSLRNVIIPFQLLIRCKGSENARRNSWF